MIYVLLIALFLNGELVNVGTASGFQSLEQCEAFMVEEAKRIATADQPYTVDHVCVPFVQGQLN